MFRTLDIAALSKVVLVCGCGGGSAVGQHLAPLMALPTPMVIDADALNAIAVDTHLQTLLTQRGARSQSTVLTPHPLEAARLLACSAAQVQANRLASAEQLAQRFQCTVVLKGSGSIMAQPGQTPVINPTGNARLATGGTGDVLAGLLGARLAQGFGAFEAACQATYQHGWVADTWPPAKPLSALDLANALSAY
jgi:hydroxyethylthiazole kinase-like uncharacterized protein yjeF